MGDEGLRVNTTLRRGCVQENHFGKEGKRSKVGFAREGAYKAILTRVNDVGFWSLIGVQRKNDWELRM